MAEHPPEVEWFGWAAQPHEVPEDADIVQLSLDNAEAVCGERGSLVGGNASLDERFFQRYYDIPVATVGPWGANLHGADEHTTTESLVETAQTVAGIALDYCGVAQE
jgi:acetylornithine deacetylase